MIKPKLTLGVAGDTLLHKKYHSQGSMESYGYLSFQKGFYKEL